MSRRQDFERFTYIDNVRIIGILLVILGHSYPFNVEIPETLDTMRSFIYCFHMELFVFISGYLVTSTQSIKRHGWKGYIGRRAKKLLFPYLGLTIICFIPKILVSAYINDSVKFSVTYFLTTVLVPRQNVWGHFWFIPTILILGVTSVLIYKIVNRKQFLYGVILILGILLLFIPYITGWLSLDDVRLYFFWYVLGMFLGELKPNLDYIKKKKWLGIAGIIVSIILFEYSKSKAIRIVIAGLMIFSLMLISTETAFYKNGLLNKIGKYSFALFIMSWPVQAVIEILANRMLGISVIPVMCIMLAGGIFVPLLAIEIMNEIPDSRFKSICCSLVGVG